MRVKITGVPKSGTKKVKISGVPTRQTGGDIPVTHGLPDGLEHFANIEAEGGEVYQDGNGQFNKISDQSPSHEAGGVPIANAKRVLEDTSTVRKDKASKMLKMSPDEIEQLFGVKAKGHMSHAKAFEHIVAEYQKQTDKFNDAQSRINKRPILDKAAVKSADLNFKNRSRVPTKDDVFDTLFEHQEAIKAANGIQDNGDVKKYGGYEYQKPKIGANKAQTGANPGDPDLGLYKGPKHPENPSNLYSPTGKTTEAKLTDKQIVDAYKAVGVDFGTARGVELQDKIYNYLIQNQPDVLRGILKDYGANNAAKRAGKDKIKAFSDPLNASVDDLKAALPYLRDSMIGARVPIPKVSQPTEEQPQQPQTVQQPQTKETFGRQPKKPDATVNPTIRKGQGSGFNEPLTWSDLAPATAELIGSFGREPELYNPVQVHQLKYKLLDPSAAMAANEADYRAAVQQVGNLPGGQGVNTANLSNVAAQKFRANNQIAAEYANQNANIQNREIDYNTQARDRQSLMDSKSREAFYSDVLQGRDNQRNQKLQAIQDLSRAIQLKARQNKSGNMIMKTFPHFDQNLDYNGVQYFGAVPVDENMPTIPQQPVKAPFKPRKKSESTVNWVAGSNVYPSQGN